MKRINVYLLAALVFVQLNSCKTEEPKPKSPFTIAPDAQADQDKKSGGVYKGVLIGSTGTIKIILQNGVIGMFVTMDGESKTLTTTSLSGWVPGQSIKRAVFQSEGWQGEFSVGTDGTFPNATLQIPGHASVDCIIAKELSSSVIKLYEGTYEGTEAGTWNFLIRSNEILGAKKAVGGTSVEVFFGSVTGGMVNFANMKASGVMTGDKVTGTWQGTTSDVKGTWSGNRTL